MRTALRVASSFALAVGAVVAVSGALLVAPRPAPAFADGPTTCTAGSPPFPFAGFCGTYSGRNTWYGTYGPGFPTAQGWALCALNAATGGDYPSPADGYTPGGAPAGAGGTWNALGFAFSEGQGNGYWTGQAGQYTRTQAAAAAKLLYDDVVWGQPVGALTPGVTAAFNAFDYWFLQAEGMAASPPQLSVGLLSGTTTFTGSATDDIHLQFPGTGHPVVGQPLLLSISGGTFNGPGGPTVIGVATNTAGNVLVTIFSTAPGTAAVTVQTTVGVGQPGLGFYHPTTGDLAAQIIAAFPAPTGLSATQHLIAHNAPLTPQGTVSVQKAGDDTAYYDLAGAVFQVLAGGSVVATLTTGGTGATAPSGELNVGTYTVHEASAPPGYQVAPDQTVTVVANVNTVVFFTGAFEDHITPASVTIHKSDAQTGAPLDGAVFDVRYSSANNGVYDEDLGACITSVAGTCSPPGDDGATLLPGDYQITETQAPAGYYLDPATAVQTVTLTPGEAGSVTFSDFLLGSLSLTKTGNDTAYVPIASAVFTVTGPSPSTAAVGTLTVGTTGSTNTISGLQPGRYTITETTPPAGYQPVTPIEVTVAVGHATTGVDVSDSVIPATVTLVKADAETGAPIAGAVLDVKYDSTGSGTYSQDLGTCTTGTGGSCVPAGNDGPDALLPGNYEVTEVTPPPGYVVDPTTSVQRVTLTPGEAGTVTFHDHLLVPASFQKVATGNVNPTQVVYAGAVIVVHQGTATGTQVATCTTATNGACTTGAVLVSGSPYCWVETVAPPGLQGGAHGCFTADNAQGAQPITVTDSGLFVPIVAKKVAAADPTVTLPAAVFDLYRIDTGHGPDAPTPPADAVAEPGQTWVARATSGSDGLADFPMQFPGYAYCVLEVTAPTNYVAAVGEQCTGVLAGAATVPAPVVTVTVADAQASVILQAHKFNALTPSSVIPGATYDLYVEGPAPLGGVPGSQPSGVSPEAGDTWYARGVTNTAGQLAWTVPAGYAWCLLEVSAPPNYVLDPALHCTGVLNAGAPLTTTTIALPETLAQVQLTAHKFDALTPTTVIPGATYELLVQGAMPTGYTAPAAPATVAAPPGDTYWAQGTSNAQGVLTFTVPAGSSWCLHELKAPSQYQLDSAYHCTGAVTTESTLAAATVALPETPAPTPGGVLAFTGGPDTWMPVAGVLMVVGGGGMVLGARRRRRARRSRREARGEVGA
jgi:Prealbumin-like fold domain